MMVPKRERDLHNEYFFPSSVLPPCPGIIIIIISLVRYETYEQVCRCNILVQDKYVAQFAAFVLQHPPQVHLFVLGQYLKNFR